MVKSLRDQSATFHCGPGVSSLLLCNISPTCRSILRICDAMDGAVARAVAMAMTIDMARARATRLWLCLGLWLGLGL